MSTERQSVAFRDLAEEAKKRIVVLIICVVGLSYLMSLTSSSVWVNLPAAAFLIISLRYFALDFEMRRKAAVYNSKAKPENIHLRKKPAEGSKAVFEKSDWRRKVNSPVVEDAIEHFTRHLVSEWVTDLWYSRMTSDRQGPEELVQIINRVIGEISSRMRNVNLIDLLTRDMINLFCMHLELFRATQAKIEKQQPGSPTLERQDMQLKFVLAKEKKLHPALFSADAEHKVLQHLMEGLISFTFKPEDLQCSLFRFIVRELLSCAVMRPVLNLASPRFINERIESLVSLSKANKKATNVKVPATASKSNVSPRISSDHFSPYLDPSVKGVELVQFKKDQSKPADQKSTIDNVNGTLLSRDPLLSMDTKSTHSWSSLPSNNQNGDGADIQRPHSGREWGDLLDRVSRRKTQALAPEHFENMWTKGRNYRSKQGSDKATEPVTKCSSLIKTEDHLKALPRQKEKAGMTKIGCAESRSVLSRYHDPPMADKLVHHENQNMSSQALVSSYAEDDVDNLMHSEEYSESSCSYTSEDEETSNVTGLDSPGTKVWDGKSNRNLTLSRIHHPLENSDGRKTRKMGKGHVHHVLHRTQTRRKRSRSSSQKVPVWQEIERTSFLSGDGQDILNSSKGHVKSEESNDDSDAETLGRIHSGETASSSAPLTSLPPMNAQKNLLLADSFLKLRCEVLGANIVKSGSKTFAVYSISVADINNNSWSIKRRFRHFEELHRRLKEFPEYNLHLPPKHFLSTGLDVPVIQERCKLLDQYLKKLLHLPTISGSIEVWDFLSVDSQTYMFSNSISIIETLSVDLDYTLHERRKKIQTAPSAAVDPLPSWREQNNAESKIAALPIKHSLVANESKLNKGAVHYSQEKPKPFEDSGSDSDNVENRNMSPAEKSIKGNEHNDLQASARTLTDATTDPALPTEWVPPSLSVPILDLVDVVFQLQDGGWIRRKAFWVAKQVLQLGMGDAFDDWLIEKIQLLRRGTVVASGIRRIEQGNLYLRKS
ncbi:uncharacterized protein LOC127795165 isoform X2 [Diospyros lotus]|uniref:uncharacterized protein LOC127795165 isoform X2 n=1 Tax=Diospyros lotus TaxID=55363 RepID=UPI00224F1C35|nr:uncharacterized protein LOC127795165 isoform X2 [Diospyros lotus]